MEVANWVVLLDQPLSLSVMADSLVVAAAAVVLWHLGIEAAVEEEHGADVVIRGIDAADVDTAAVALALVVVVVAGEVVEGLERLHYPAHQVLFLVVQAPGLLADASSFLRPDDGITEAVPGAVHRTDS
jgi:hypothetical protein